MENKCPTCQNLCLFDSSNPWRPFCSERCKLIDMGDWISANHHIPGEPAMPIDEEGKLPDELN